MSKGEGKWHNGGTQFQDYWAKLTPEERAAKLHERRVRKKMNERMEQVVQEQQNKWLAGFNNILAVHLQKALEGDVQSALFVRDSLGLKPKDDKEHMDGSAEDIINAVKLLAENLPE